MMSLSLARRAAVVGLGMASTLALSLGVAGCGGAAQDSSDAVVVTEPGVTVPAAGSTPAPAVGSTSTAPAAAAAPAASAVKAEGWGTLKGQVVFGGAPPERPVLQEKGKAEKDPTYCAKDSPILSERLVVDAATKGVKNVFVYLPKPTAVNEEAKSGASTAEVVFDQQKCVFVPHAVAFQAGTKMTLKSSDPVQHNVDAKLSKNALFNSVLAANASMTYTANTGERSPMPVICDIHPWMQAYWLVLDNPYFAVTDEKGNFEIKNVPAGTQKVVVWQEATGFVTPPSGEEVTLKANDTTAKSFTVDPAKVKPAK